MRLDAFVRLNAFGNIPDVALSFSTWALIFSSLGVFKLLVLHYIVDSLFYFFRI
jgi:hypothetical protein